MNGDGQFLDVNGNVITDPRTVRALQGQNEQIARQQAQVPDKGEQRRLAAVQFAIASRGQAGFDVGADLIATAKAIDKFIQSGPNT